MNAANDTGSGKADNARIADTLQRAADLLEAQGKNAYRVTSYRNAAETVRDLNKPVTKLLKEDGDESLENLPGVGRKLAGRIHEQLGISTLEELEIAAHDGRLEDRVEDIGPEKAEGICVALSGMLSRSSRRRMRQRSIETAEQKEEPAIALLLDVDKTYRRKAEQGELRKIAPKRFNPKGERWLPIMKTKRNGWQFTVLFSNTARAHERNKTDDWVVLYYEKDGRERQCTVVTAERGKLQGKRVVRGRERQCRRYYGV